MDTTRTPYRSDSTRDEAHDGAATSDGLALLAIDRLLDGLILLKTVRDTSGAPVDFAFVRMNPSAEALLDRPASSLIGNRVLDVWPDAAESGLLQTCMQAAVKGESIRHESSFERAGRRVWIEMVAVDLEGGIAVTCRDITDRKEAEEQLVRYTTELETTQFMLEEQTMELADAIAELQSAKDIAESAVGARNRLLAHLRHEIRTPMHGVLGLAHLLTQTGLREDQHGFVEKIRSSGQALQDIVQDLGDLDGEPASEVEPARRPLSIVQEVEKTIDVMAGGAYEKGLELAYYIGANVPVAVHGDARLLHQVLVNLIENAVQWTERGEIVLSAEVTAMTDSQYEIHLAVSDTGAGIEEEAAVRLNELIEEGKGTRAKAGENGQGLAFCSRLVHLMGGRFWFESSPGQGSTFHFTVTAEAAPSGKRMTGRHLALREKRILIVVSNEVHRQILARLTLSWGMIPITLDSAPRALEWTQQRIPYDVVLLDLDTFGDKQDGLELAHTLAARFPDLPLILFAPIGKHVHDPVLAASLTKPVKQIDLYTTLIRILEPSPE